MNINSLNNKVEKRVKIASKRRDLREVGPFLKKKRKELNITQDEIAKGICSISYLSKIENNQIIPKEFYIKELFNRMDIDQEVYQKTINDALYLETMIDGIFFKDDDLIKKTYIEIKDITNSLTLNIAKFAYSVYLNKTKALSILKSLENLINNMDTFELKSYLLISAIYYSRTSKYKKTLEILFNNKKLTFSNDKLESLIYYYQYISKQHIGLKNSSYEDYYRCINILNIYHNEKRKLEILLFKISFITEENSIYALKLLSEINSKVLSFEQRSYYYLLKGEIYLSLNDFSKSKESLELVSNNSRQAIPKNILLYQLSSVSDDNVLKKESLNKIKSFKFSKNTIKYKIIFEVLALSNDQDLKQYLKDIAIPYSIEIEDVYSIKKYSFMIMDICCENSRYKEALQHFNKYKKEINKLYVI